MRGLKGKTAIVTGGAAGIGAAIVKRFEEEGTRVIVFDLKGDPPVDITDYDRVKAAVAAAGPACLRPLELAVRRCGNASDDPKPR